MIRAIGALVILGAVTIALSFSARAQRPRPLPTYVIDLLSYASDRPEEGGVPQAERLRLPFGRHGRPTHEPPPEQPLTLTLLTLDRTLYSVGDPFVYEISVTNNGHRAVAFPTSPDGSRFRRNMPRATGAFINLVLEDSLLGQQVVGTQALYGAPDVSGSIVILSPGETLEVRAPGTWHLQSAFPKPPPDHWSRDVELLASLELFSSHTPPPPRLTSENKIQVRLRKN